jgi:transposase-like protein
MTPKEADINCPRCGKQAHEIYMGDTVKRWRCMGCETIFSAVEGWQVQDGDLVLVLETRRQSWRLPGWWKMTTRV